jgi:hypothetical protein
VTGRTGCGRSRRSELAAVAIIGAWVAACAAPPPPPSPLRSGVATGGEPRIASSGFQSVPRERARAAEWIARQDPAAKAAIDDYDTCCGSTWDPARPGVVSMGWTRPCAASVGPAGYELAATGDCFDSLEVVVDVGRALVLSIDRRPGP